MSEPRKQKLFTAQSNRSNTVIPTDRDNLRLSASDAATACARLNARRDFILDVLYCGRVTNEQHTALRTLITEVEQEITRWQDSFLKELDEVKP